MNRKSSTKKSEYATVGLDEGVNYREIADMMTDIGFKMNHSSARNYVLRIMRKFAVAIIDGWDVEVPEHKIDSIIKTPKFQNAICSILHNLEAEDKRPHQKAEGNLA